mmetsp:Transcript_5530/g.12234  ORF Transcript_5530/g.12234 Transcript_5530/m.12234 type:complete len:374 (-) Transcript_5530:247-1368(-)
MLGTISFAASTKSSTVITGSNWPSCQRSITSSISTAISELLSTPLFEFIEHISSSALSQTRFNPRINAPLATADKSAPLKVGGNDSIAFRSIDARSIPASNLNLRVCAKSICRQCSFVFAGPRYRRRSNRPGRSRLGSRRSGLLVAPITMMFTADEFFFGSAASEPLATPSSPLSNSASKVAVTRSITPSPCPVSPRLGAKESSSSKKRTEAPAYPPLWQPFPSAEVDADAAARAAAKTSRTLASLSPTYEPNSSGPLIERNGIPHSRATALAMRVFPVPGGPKQRMPDLRLPSNSFGYFNGNSTASIISFLIDSMPPMSSQRTFGSDDNESGTLLDPPPRELLTACSRDLMLLSFDMIGSRTVVGDVLFKGG